MALKIDLEKAYDKLELNFIKKVLQKFNFPEKFIHWIMLSITTVNFSLSINGFTSEKWTPNRGIRQGDPLSPHIFIMCLHFLILKFVEGHQNKLFHGFSNKQKHSTNTLFFVLQMIV